MTSFDAIVVGGGFSGVAAARDLRAAGRSVLLLEARDRLGGRTWARPFGGTDQHVELGGTWVAPKYHRFVDEEIKRYDLKLTESHGGPTRFRWCFGGPPSSSFPVEDDALYDLERALFEIIRCSRRITTEVPRDQQDLADLDVPVAEFLDGLEIGSQCRRFLEGWLALGSGAAPGEWSALTALSWVAAMDNSAWGWFAAVAEKFAIGTAGVLERIVADADPKVALSSPVRRIAQQKEDVAVTTAQGCEYTAEFVVVATPIATWNDIEWVPGLSAVKVAASRNPHRGRMKKLWIRATGVPADVIHFGLGARLLWLSAEYDLGDSRLLVAFSSPQNRLDVVDLESVTAAVQEYAPDARVLGVNTHDWVSDPYSKGTWMVNRPGELSRHASALQGSEGRLVFAGADLATRWIGWIDGALESGTRAANSVLSGQLHHAEPAT